ncbi:hypothetical protein [Microbacterium azadirachtae]|uniref:hypothetical protein n=1 Tax=Microbacterium azadirachtae TaxID=582680 RepID=UPI00088F2112|nr:hypothetical protein [Microbacterium azadirachtae]SDM27560.1 hypothetical protein SAMN04488593_3101 [Microbacterium azadirachtae]SEG49212.1 hypothetical protein SAMN04488594_3180 [Microbacterium azadirachtae]SEG50812.1 hypothetical protein SAMN04488592_3095 [Microbacterium azadirachtae]
MPEVAALPRWAARSYARTPAWAGILALYLGARLITTAMLLIATGLSGGPGSRFGAHATIASFVSGWDAQWYWYIAVYGYPTTLPLGPDGHITQNSWAFLPLYAWVSKAVGLPFGEGGWPIGAAIVSLVAGYLCCLVLFRMMRDRIGRMAAVWTVIFFAAGPLGALFQVGYAEVLNMLFLLLALDGLMRRRYVRLYPLIVLMAFTRPGVLAFALMLGLMLVLRWFRRRADPLSGREIAHYLGLGALAVVTGFAWQVIAGIATGVPNAYLETELSWRGFWMPQHGAPSFAPFEGWLSAMPYWARLLGVPGWVGLVVLGLAVLLFAAALVLGPGVRRLGPEIRLYAASYALYLLAVFFPQSSTLRLMFPLAPLWGAVGWRRSWWLRGAVLVVCLGLQWVWIANVYGYADTFWRVP